MATILAIEDRQDDLTALSRVLERLIHGCTVVTAQSGAEGIEKAIAELPDVILLDVINPGMDGYEVCKRLKSDEKTKYIPVIMLTNIQSDLESRLRGLEIGADAFLAKPIDAVELVAQVNAMLRIKSAEDLLRNVYGCDVTEQRRIQGLLKERETKPLPSRKMEGLGTPVPEGAHELNTPITLMLFNVPLLQRIWHDLQPIVARYACNEPDKKYGGLKYEYLQKRMGQLLDDMDLASNRIANTLSGLKNFTRHSDVADKKPVLNLVRAQGGAITFQNRNRKGTTFTVSFPSALKEKRAKILVVDDDREIRETLAEALTTFGPYLADKAPNGVEACIKLGTNRPDLIVLDIFMPEMDGLEVCQKLKREPELSDIKVLITTASPDHPKVKEVAELGFSNICYKPFTIVDFVNRVDKCLRHGN